MQTPRSNFEGAWRLAQVIPELQSETTLVGFCCQPPALYGNLAHRIEQLTTMNEGQIRRKVFLRLLGSPLVVAPFVLGITGCMAVWALNWPAGLGWFACVAGALSSAGAYLTRLIFDDGKIARAVVAEAEQQDRQAEQSALDDLDRRLVQADDDPRPETALRDLRALVRAFDEFANQTDALRAPAVVDVQSRVRQIFDSSVRALEQTLHLGDTAKQLRMAEARKPLLEQRERVIKDIQAGVKQLGGTLAALQRLDTGGESNHELARLRDELDQSLQIARRVEARLGSLLDHTETDVRSTPPRLRAADNQKGN
ncbi:MAG: hypothetical protein DME26_05210 [Verrucomicrobia bacterium]|nr:MAG: hypothetical protein DME26_05210 [Verrucomicrobiota bacterium]